MNMLANNSGTALKEKHYWWIARSDKTFKHMTKRDDWDNKWTLPAVSGRWIYELLTREDRDILVRADDSGVFHEVWPELDKIRSAQYDDLIEKKRADKQQAAEKLIEEVRRNG